MVSIAHILKLAVFHHGTTDDGLATHMKTNQQSKARLELKLLGKQKDIRAILVDRVLIQHEIRLVANIHTSFTGTSTDAGTHKVNLPCNNIKKRVTEFVLEGTGSRDEIQIFRQ
jgi:hypothetical protein